MRVKILTFRYSNTLGGFDDGPLAEFTRDKEVLSFREHFFLVNDVPHMSCVLTYEQPAVTGREDLPVRKSEAPLELSEGERLLYNTLREWRMTAARAEGVPPYVLFTNRQLAAIAGKRPDSLTALAGLPGIGAAKVRRYGQAVLELLHGKGAPEPASQEAQP